MRKFMPVIVLFVLLISFITLVSATDVNETSKLTDNTITHESSVTADSIITEKTVEKVDTTPVKEDSADTIVKDDCASVIIQGNGNDSVISYRRDSLQEVTLNITHNQTFIQQVVDANYSSLHVLVTKDGWIVGNGGIDSNRNSILIRENVFTMIKNNNITSENFNNIIDLKSKITRGHFVIKSPTGEYALFMKNNNNTYNERGTIKPGDCLVVPNDPAFFNKGWYQNISGQSGGVIASSRLIAAKDKSAPNRRDITTYSYKQTGKTSNVKIYACNDNGTYVNLNTGVLVDAIRTNTKYYSKEAIPALDKWPVIDDVNFTLKQNTTIRSKDMKVNSPDITLTTTVTDEYGRPVNEGFVSFLFDDRTIKNKDGNVSYVYVVNGTASINHTIVNFWKKTNHTYYARYYGNSHYESNLGNKAAVNESRVFNLRSKHASDTRFGTNLTITAFVNYTASDDPVNRGLVLFKVNGKTIRNPDNSTLTVDIKKGTAVFNLILDEKYSAKEYKVTVVYGYGAFREEYNSTVLIHKVPTDVKDLKVNVENNNVEVKGTFVDDNGKPIPYNSYLSVKIDGKTIKDAQNATRTFNITDSVINFTFELQYHYRVGNHTLMLVIPELRETLGVRINTTMTITE